VLTLEVREAEGRFRQQAELIFASLHERVHANEVVLEGFAAALRSLPSSDDGRVREYARAMLARYPHIHKLTISPRVPGHNRVPFETRMQLLGYPDYSVRAFALEEGRSWKPAPEAEVHYPIAFVEPMAASPEDRVLGLDLSSAPHLRAALLAALDRNATAATVPFDLAEGGRGYVLFRPVCASYQESCSGEAVEVTPRLVAGMMVRADSLVACDPGPFADLSCTLYQGETYRDPDGRLLDSRAEHEASTVERLLFPRLRFDRTVDAGAQRLVLTVSQQLGFRSFNLVPAAALLAVSAGGLALVLAAVRGRERSERERQRAYQALAAERAHLEERVRVRTAELSRLNAELCEENAARQVVEERLALKERQARGLARRILGVQEEERQALARELHDDVGQSLTAIRTHARLIQDQAPDPVSPVARSAEAIGAVAADLYDSVHRLMRRLRPRALDDVGIVGAFKSCVAAAELEPLGVCVHQDFSGNLDGLDEAVSIALYRVLQEALTNVARHSAARNVWVRLARTEAVDEGQGGAAGDGVTLHDTCVAPEDENLGVMKGCPPPLPSPQEGEGDKGRLRRIFTVALEVSDDGRGMAEVDASTGFGLVGLRERVEALGGTFDLDSAPGRGVTLRARVPVQTG
jgi:signal transduction histidine kinase